MNSELSFEGSDPSQIVPQALPLKKTISQRPILGVCSLENNWQVWRLVLYLFLFWQLISVLVRRLLCVC